MTFHMAALPRYTNCHPGQQYYRCRCGRRPNGKGQDKALPKVEHAEPESKKTISAAAMEKNVLTFL